MSSDAPSAFEVVDDLLNEQISFKNWIVTSMNDSVAIGGMRAMKHHDFKAANIIVIGINGTDCIDELKNL